MSLYSDVTIKVLAVQSAETGYASGSSAKLDVKQALTSGTTANKADLKHSSIRSIAGSGNEDVDMRALEDGQGNVLTTLTEVVVFAIKAAAANGGALRVKPSASSGWAALLSGSSNYLIVQPGATLILVCPADGKYAVGSSTKSINVENTDASAASYELLIVGRSA